MIDLIRRMVSAVLFLCFPVSTLCVSAKMVPWDGYKEPPRESDTKVFD